MWKDLGKTFGELFTGCLTADNGETFKTFTSREDRKEVINVPSIKTELADESEICECLVLSTRHLIDGVMLGK